MKLTRIHAANVLGAHSVDIYPSTPITILAGHNHAGKSSVQEALRMALTQEATRVQYKKDYPQLVCDLQGAKTGQAEVVFEKDGKTVEAWMLLPKGSVSPQAEYSPHPLISYVLEPALFARMDGKARRGMLFDLMGVKVSPAEIKSRLLKRHLDKDRIERILPLLRAGMAEASKDAKGKATEAKGAWRAVAGEVYGPEKANGWKAEKPTFDEAQASTLHQRVTQLDATITQASEDVGSLKARIDAHTQAQHEEQSLREQAGMLERHRRKLQTDEAALATQQQALAELTISQQTQSATACPECNAMLIWKDGALVCAGPLAKGTEDDLGRIPALKASVDLCTKTVNNTRRDLVAAEQADATLKARATAEAPPKASDLETAQNRLGVLRTERQELTAKLDAVAAAKRATAEADKKTADARAHHEDVIAWDAIGDALGSNGIPAELLAEALQPFNERLKLAAEDTLWPLVKLDDEMAVRVQHGSVWRPYSMLSESEQWRADAVLAEAISFMSGLRLLALDRFDVLDTPGRMQLLAWLDNLVANDEIDSAFITGTLKTLPTGLQPSITSHWIERGNLQRPAAPSSTTTNREPATA
ncbi:MAG: AAA family ATPase [Aquabacterium sp.]|uniref:AAA family ATPase n=1 Tax=Aquabacterium sp. TaxID=1872578 RepID=UPI003BAE51CB